MDDPEALVMARECAVRALLALLPQAPAEKRGKVLARIARIKSGQADQATEVRAALVAIETR